MKKKINIAQKLSQFKDHWNPRIIGELNHQHIKLAKLKGEFIWHKHDDTDETFVVINGHLTIEFRDSKVHLKPGEMIVVPMGTEHRPIASEECEIMLIEPRGVINTGDKKNAYTQNSEVWI